jgi:hypothetical protein
MKKSSFHPLCLPYELVLVSAFSTAVFSLQADQIKANNNSALELGSSWVGGVAPGGSGNAIWNSTVAAAVNCIGGVGNMGISFPTQPGYGCRVEYRTNLTDAVWIPLGNTVTGDGTSHSLNYPAGADTRFYRVQIQ